MDDLIKFLRARLDEDEREARDAALAVADHTYAPVDAPQYAEQSGRWHAANWLYQKRVRADAPEDWEARVIESAWPEVADHIARHDPARVLADVAAKRAVVDDLATARKEAKAHPEDMANKGWVLAVLRSIHYLATAYADHPSFRAEWRLGAGTTPPGE